MEEWKIGEIKQINGEWYQCVEGNGCENCAFKGRKCYLEGDTDDPIGECCYDRRRDDKDVIFKKLEKVGEPMEFTRGLYFQRYRLVDSTAFYEGDTRLFFNAPTQTFVYIEIKQTNKDMGDNDDIRPYDELFSPGTVSNTKYLAKEDMEEKKLNLKPFDIQKAREGKPVCTRDGRKARIICFDLKNGEYPIVAAIGNDSSETLLSYTINGEIVKGNYKSEKDLVMRPEKKKRMGEYSQRKR